MWGGRRYPIRGVTPLLGPDVSGLLRACRDAQGLTLRAAAARTGLASSSMSQWETGVCLPPEEAVAVLDGGYQQQGVLAALVQAARRAVAVPADTWWSFHPSVAPAFAWIRLPGGAAGRAHMSWGPWRLLCEVEGVAGIAVVSSVVFPNPPLIVELEPAGRVDVVTGTPPAWLTPRVVDALKQLDVQSTPHRTLGIVGELLWNSGSTTGQRPMMPPHLARRLAQSVRPFQHFDPQELPPQALNDSGYGGDGALARAAREAEGLSRKDLVQRCKMLAGSSGLTTEERIRGFERGVQTRPEVVGEVDVGLGLGGRLGPSLVTSAQDAASVRFPGAYVGPIWLELVPTSLRADPVIKLRWGRYQKLLRPARDARVWLTKSWPNDEPLEVLASNWSVRAGIGRIAGAHDVHVDWTLDYLYLRNEIRRGVEQFLASRRTARPG